MCYNRKKWGAGRFTEVRMDEKMTREQLDELVGAMLSLRGEEEARRFFEDLFTVGELQAVSQRLAVARLLRRGAKYQEIAEKTGASTATISRVNRALLYGAGGYRSVLAHMDGAKGAAKDEEA